MNTGTAYPLTAFQRKLWAGQQLAPQSPLYNMALAVKINTALDADRLNTVWGQLQGAHPSLRFRIEKQDDTLVQIADDNVLPIEQHDFSGAQDPDAEAQAFLKDTTKTLFSAGSVLTRCLLLKLSDELWIWYIKQHHVVTDAQSFTSIWQSVDSAYHQRDGDTTQPYPDYVQHVAKTAIPTNLQTYWEAQRAQQPLSLASSRTTQTTGSLRQPLALTPAKLEQLTQLVALNSVRSFSGHLSKQVLFMTLLTAYLHRISNDTTITLGVPVPNRDQPQFRHTPGLFVEVLPLQLEVRANDTFNTLATRTRSALLDHFKHARSGACEYGQGAMVSAVVNYINATLVPWGEHTPIEATWIHPDHADQQHAVRLQVSDWTNSGVPTLELDSNLGVFTEQQQKCMPGHWWQLFDAMSRDADSAVGSVPLLLDDDKHRMQQRQLSHNWPAAANTHPVLERIVSKAHEQPDAIALRQNTVALSYRKLDELSTLIADRLQAMGIGRGHRVALQMQRSSAWVVSALGVMKSGAAYVPIDANTPEGRLATIVADAEPAVLLTDDATGGCSKEDVTNNGVPRIQYEDLISRVFTASVKPAQCTLGNSSTAYVLYTSGSTGKPKGVVVSNDALGNYINWASAFYAKDKPANMPLFTPLGFDLTVTSLFLPLVTGGTLHVYPEQHAQADTGVMDVFNNPQLDIVKLTPAHLALIQHLDLSNNNTQQLIVGGESLQKTLAHRVAQSFGGDVQIHNEYGPTECTVGCVVHTYHPDDAGATVPIGKPVSGVQTHVLNADLQIQPAGSLGELYLSGASLADGYWNNNELTQQAFSTQAHLGNTRLYKTGDVVHLNPHGQLIYHGRTDTQIKVRGVRIELDEIQNTCLAIESVTDCLVVHSAPSVSTEEEQFCTRCGLSSRFPDATLDASKLCSLCIQYDNYRDRTRAYFRSMSDLSTLIDKVKETPSGDYDCIVLLSGGKDSTYALSRMMDTGLRIMAFTLDNGYISDQAKANIDRVCKTLQVDHRYGQTPHMNEIFVDSLKRYSNVCNGCFKVLYTLAMELANDLNVSTIVTGLSQGQFFETRLTEELFTSDQFTIQHIDASILSARKAYHLVDDAVSKCMNVEHVRQPGIFERIQIIDFYRYCDVSLEQMYDYLSSRVPWIRPDDTGRSTNCLINDAGIHVHKVERGFHNYSLPYSWDVRLGHKQRDEALHELNDDIDLPDVNRILDEIGYTITPLGESNTNEIALYYTSTDSTVDSAEVRQKLLNTLPRWMQPQYIVPLPAFPINNNGKIDRTALPKPALSRDLLSTQYQKPGTDTETWMASLWTKLLKVDSVGVNDNFFELNGDSLTAIRMASLINQEGYNCTVADLFAHPTVGGLCDVLKRGDAVSDVAVQASIPTAAFDAIDTNQLDQLNKLLAQRKNP